MTRLGQDMSTSALLPQKHLSECTITLSRTASSTESETRPRHEYYQPLQPYKSPGIQPSKGTNILGNSRGSSESDVLLGTRPCPHGRALVHALASTNSPMRTLMLMLQSSLTILLVVTSMQQAKGPTVCGRLTRGRLAVAPCDRFPCI
ncbi:hypothetical protein D6D15_02756 [Aureobasidium pullulans]|uniref:Uncharacterized protein n=1 Tax=Aureobasidium pullulans TaxID=5580 RepID=A0A4S9BI13_AURPU|nr:hypothetical protein D6D15_02756 [Aureobasidium pullulans]